MIKECIVLAGGLGTRLREAVPDLPKCMAPVAGRPFLFYVINYLRSQGIEKFIFSLGYMHEVIEAYLTDQFKTLNYEIVIETEPLGTGGAIKLACSKAGEMGEENIAVVNGDTLFKINLELAYKFHQQQNAECTLLLKPMQQFDRYGVVELKESGQVKNFDEKKYYHTGNINGGVYILNLNHFTKHSFPEKYSFEKEYLEKQFSSGAIYGHVQDEYFIDIGIPEDFNRVQKELNTLPLHLSVINKEWTVFIDRDGVMNREKKDDYIRNWDEFSFYDGVIDAFKIVSKKFGRVIIISNQRGVGRGLMTPEDLHMIDKKMRAAIEEAGGRIDHSYYCTATDNKYYLRKPNPGMAYQAKSEFPAIDLSKTIMIGNKPSDMLFGKNAGTYTVYIASTHPETPFPHQDIDLRYNSLIDFAKAL
jgi:D-glycero-alpha-D-manno-heptose 1-phosphate guanylyltransferase